MGSGEEEGEERNEGGIVVSRCLGWLLGSVMVSVGGAMLIWWRLKFHPNNKQLWMVPLGLILFGTPIVTCLSVLLSSALSSSHGHRSSASRLRQSTVVPELDGSAPHPNPESPIGVRHH